jgi:heat shock protein HslJ
LIFFIACEGTKTSKGNNDTPLMSLSGTWQLVELPNAKFSFDSLYTSAKPFINFDLANKRFSGNSSCNHFGGELIIQDNKLDFARSIIITEMYCGGEGEPVFINTLISIDNFSIRDSSLLFMKGDTVKMAFKKK